MIIRNLFKVTITLLVVAFCAFESQAQEQKDILINFEFIKSNGETNYKVKYKLNSILTDSIASVSHYFLSNGDTIVADSCTFEQCNLEIIDQNTIGYVFKKEEGKLKKHFLNLFRYFSLNSQKKLKNSGVVE